MLIGRQIHLQAAAVLTSVVMLLQIGTNVKFDIIGRVIGVFGFALVYGSLEKKKRNEDIILEDDDNGEEFKQPRAPSGISSSQFFTQPRTSMGLTTQSQGTFVQR